MLWSIKGQQTFHAGLFYMYNCFPDENKHNMTITVAICLHVPCGPHPAGHSQ